MSNSTNRNHWAVFSLIFLLLFSCNGEKKPNADAPKGVIKPSEQHFEATVKKGTAPIPYSIVQDMESHDPKTGTYVFSGSPSELENLKPGTVVLFEAHSLGKIKSVKKEGGKTVIETSTAKLTDYFQNAKISYSAPITWDNPAVAKASIKLGSPIAAIYPTTLGSTAAAQDEGLHVKIEKEIKGWKVGLELTPKTGNKLKIKLSAEKGKGHVCSIVAEGYISSFVNESNIVIENGQTQTFSHTNKGLKGEMEIKFAAVGLGSKIAFLEIPATIEKTILVQGIIPVTLRLKANLKIYPEVAVGSSSQASVKLTYNSDIGFSYSNGSVTPRGKMSDADVKQTGDSNTATTGIAGMGVGVEFPRFEIGILGKTVVPYLLLNTHASSYLNTGLLSATPPCHQATCKYAAHAGVSLGFFGLGSINNDYKLFEDEKKWVADGSNCD